MAVTRRTRFEVLRRDEHRCRYCGAKAPEVELTVDHVVPVALGGSDHPSNLVAACRDCNSGKTSTTPDAPLVAETNAMAMAWSRAMATAAEERAQAYAEDRRLANDFREMWENWVWTDSRGEEHPHELPANFSTSVRNVLAAGLTFADLEELIAATMQTRNVRDRFKYFCGCCWTRVRQAQERALEILAREQPVETQPPREVAPARAITNFSGVSSVAELLEELSEGLKQQYDPDESMNSPR